MATVKKPKARVVARKKANPAAAVNRHFWETPAAQVVENMESLLPPGHQGLLPVAKPEPVETDRERRIRQAGATKVTRVEDKGQTLAAFDDV